MQGWVLGRTEIPVLQRMSKADPGLLHSLFAALGTVALQAPRCLFQQSHNGSAGSNAETSGAAAPDGGDAFGQQEMNRRRCVPGTELCIAPGCSQAGSH